MALAAVYAGTSDHAAERSAIAARREGKPGQRPAEKIAIRSRQRRTPKPDDGAPHGEFRAILPIEAGLSQFALPEVQTEDRRSP